jgi:hypothetical protein
MGRRTNLQCGQQKQKHIIWQKFLGPTLLASFKDSLPANEQVELDLIKSNILAKNRCKAMNLHMMNLKPSDQVAKAEQTAKLLSLKLKEKGDPSELEFKIVSTEAMYGILLNKEMKTVKSFFKHLISV